MVFIRPQYLADLGFDKFCHADGDGGDGGGGAGAGGGAGGAGAGGGTAPPDFLSQIPEAIRGEAAFKDIKDVGTLASSFHNAQKMLGVPADQLVRLPAPDDAAAWSGVWDRLGRPESADKYALSDPKEPPAGFTVNPEKKAGFAKFAHENGLNQKQADAAYQYFNTERIGRYNETMAAIAGGIAQVETHLKSADGWGAAYDQKSGFVNTLVEHLETQFKLGGQLREAIDATGGDTGIALRQALAEVGALMQEHNLIGKGGAAEGALTPAEASQQINALFADSEFVKQLNDKSAPGHADALAKITRLYQFQTPQAA